MSTRIMGQAAGPIAPVADPARIRGLDALRGVALLGILWANVRQMFLPWDIGNFAVSLGGNERLAEVDWQVFHALLDLKFITLFSLLFGIGFSLQSERLAERGHGFAALYLRRVLILALFGIAHGLLLYPAEVLLPYAVAGLLLLAMHRLSGHALVRIGLVLLGITTVWGYQIGSIGRVYAGITALTLLLLIVTVVTIWRRSRALTLAVWVVIVVTAACAITLRFDTITSAPGIAHEYQSAQWQLEAMSSDNAGDWPEEFRVRREGDFAALVGLHARQYGAILFYFAIMLLWRTLGLFMIGAGLYRSGLLSTVARSTWRKTAVIALGIGLPLSIVATWLHGSEIQGDIDWRLPEFLHAFSALPLAAGIAAAVFASHQSVALHWLWARIEAAGRMALSNYIGQSFTMAALAETWGLGLYGRLTGPALTLLAMIVFAVLAMLSHAWLKRYRMGPLEWLWRCGAYWQWLPNRRLNSGNRESAPEETAAP